MEQQPLVSVVIPSYNKKGSIKRAVLSVLDQTYNNIEIIIVDDGSTDGTDKVIFELAKSIQNVKCIKNETNLGLVKTLNKGIVAARGKYIARLDDDDYWCDKDKIKKQVDFLENNPDYVLVGGWAIEADSKGKEITKYLPPEKDEDIRKKILGGDAFIHVTVIFKKDAWENAKGYDESFNGIEDWELWLKMGLTKKFYNIQEIFAVHLGHNKSNLSYFEKRYSREKRLKLSIRLVKKYRNYYPGYKKAMLYCCARYLYSFLFFKKQIRPLLLKLKNLLSF